jgi:TrmH family RNA methyltransferase
VSDRPLTSGSKLAKRLRKLVNQRKARSQERAFVVDGPKLVAEALDPAGHAEVETVVVGPRVDDASAGVIALAETSGVTVQRVDDSVLRTILDPVTPQPVAAIVARRDHTVDDLASTAMALCLVEARDPGNVGTLIRSAEAAGAAGLVLIGASVDPTNPKTVRASAGSVLRVPTVHLPDLNDAMAELAATGRPLVATVARGEAIPYDEVRLVDAAVLLGNEAHGLPEAVIARADVTATIPLAGSTESLNLAVAGSLFCFEALRQRRRTGTGNSLDT